MVCKAYQNDTLIAPCFSIKLKGMCIAYYHTQCMQTLLCNSININSSKPASEVSKALQISCWAEFSFCFEFQVNSDQEST